MENFIMVIGCPRSGTTMLRNMLSEHPDVFIFPQTQFINKIWGARNLYNFKKNRNKILQIISEDRAVKKSGLNLFMDGKSKKNKFHDYFAEYIDFIKDYNLDNKKILGDKTPRHTMFIKMLKQKLPVKMKIIAIVRDSRAVIASMKTRKLIQSVEKGAAVWNIFSKHLKELRKTLPQGEFVLVKYEDVIDDPVSCLKSISKFLTIEYSVRMLNISESNSSYVSVKKNGIYSDSLNIWEKKLTPNEIRIITYLTQKHLRLFSYDTSRVPNVLSSKSKLKYAFANLEEYMILILIKLGIFPAAFLG